MRLNELRPVAQVVKYREGHLTFAVHVSKKELRVLSKSACVTLAHQQELWPAAPVYPEYHEQLTGKAEERILVRYADKAKSSVYELPMPSETLAAFARLSHMPEYDVQRPYKILIADARLDPAAPRASNLTVLIQRNILDFVTSCQTAEDAPTRLGLLVRLISDCQLLQHQAENVNSEQASFLNGPADINVAFVRQRRKGDWLH